MESRLSLRCICNRGVAALGTSPTNCQLKLEQNDPKLDVVTVEVRSILQYLGVIVSGPSITSDVDENF